jgi:hypothetical protein
MPTTRDAMTGQLLICWPAPRRVTRALASFCILGRAVSLTVLLASLAFALPAQSSSPDAQSAPAAQKDFSPKPNPSPKPKKVITNEDLEAHTASNGQSHPTGKIVAGDFSSPLKCEATCEQEARERSGYDSDREAEWRMQIVNARSDLAADTEWREILSQAIQQTQMYCRLLTQESQKVSPSGNSYNARVQRAQAEQYFQNMDRTLRQTLESLTSRMNARIQAVSQLSPVRAALMNVQGSRIFYRGCDSPR